VLFFKEVKFDEGIIIFFFFLTDRFREIDLNRTGYFLSNLNLNWTLKWIKDNSVT